MTLSERRCGHLHQSPIARAQASLQGEWSLTEPDPQVFYSNNKGADPAPRVVVATEQTGSPISDHSKALDPPIPTTTPNKVVLASTP